MALLPKQIYGFSTVTTKIPVSPFTEIEKKSKNENEIQKTPDSQSSPFQKEPSWRHHKLHKRQHFQKNNSGKTGFLTSRRRNRIHILHLKQNQFKIDQRPQLVAPGLWLLKENISRDRHKQGHS